MASHEERKADTRGRIIAAARQLIRETGTTGIAMRPLAMRAGLSLATPYNLFGSKQAILERLLEDNLDSFRAALSRLNAADPLERIFQTIKLAAEFYLADAKFYRALFVGLFDSGSIELRSFYTPERQSFWEDLIRAAVAAGLLLPETDVAAVARTIRHVFAGVLHSWATSGGKVADLEAELGFGTSLCLCGAASPEAAGRIRAKLADYQQRLGQ